MAEEPHSGCSFTIEEMRADDPRLRQFLEIPEEAKQSSFHATIQLLPGPDKLEIENVVTGGNPVNSDVSTLTLCALD